MTLVRFDPLDSLFFRDGSPYQQGETNQSGTASMFPPAPPTLAGAVRAACARALGWKDGSNWCENEEICEQLGNGEELGKLYFRGPFLVRCKSSSNEDKGKYGKTELLFPAPANLIGKIDKPDNKLGNENDKPTVESLTWLSPSSTPFCCDLGKDIRLPAVVVNPRPEGAKLLYEKGWWITAEGLEQVLQNKRPEERHLVHQSQLWSKEPRIGIARSDDSRTTKEGAMYSPSHIRLKRGVSIAMEVGGLSQECKKELPKQPQPVGGESRACWLHVCEHSLPFPKLPNISEETLCYTAIALTPIAVSKPPTPKENNYAKLPGLIISACLPRPMILGGWDSLVRKPLPLKPYLAPGSVLFLEAKTEERENVKKLHNHAIGNRTEWGFGLVAIGIWNDSHK